MKSIIKSITDKTPEIQSNLDETKIILNTIDISLKELNYAIIAGEIYSKFYKESELVKLKEKAITDLIAQQRVKECEQMVNFFDKRLQNHVQMLILLKII